MATIDASIPLGIRPAQIENPMNVLARVMQLKGLQQDQQFGQMKMDDHRQGIERRNKLDSILAGEYKNPEERENALLRGGFVDESAKMSKDRRDNVKTDAETAKQRAETAGKKIGHYRDAVSAVADPTSAAQFITAMHRDPDLQGTALTAVPLEKLLAQVPQDPAQFQEFKRRFVLGAEKFAEDERVRAQQAETGRHNRTTEGLTARGQDISSQTQIRGQDLSDKRARDFNAIQQDANNIKRSEKKEVQDLTKNSQIASMDTMLGTLDRLSAHPGLSRSVGITGALPTMPGSNSANFQAELNTFQSQAFIPMVAQLKGMGALSDAEGKKLTAAVGALDPRMGEEAFRSSVARIIDDMEAARERLAGSRRTPKAPNTTPGPVSGKVVDFGSLK